MTWQFPQLKIKPPKDAIIQGFPKPPEGMMVWQNRKNRYVVLVCGYYADPAARTEAWFQAATVGLRAHEIDSEYLCSFASRGGMKVLPWLDENPEKFTRSHTNYRRGNVWTIPEHWHLLGGMDYGGNRNPTSFHIYAIDEKKMWHSIWEYYKPSHYREISEALLNHPLYPRLTKIVVDPTVYKRDQHVEGRIGAFTSVGELLEEAGVNILEPANNDRAAGLARLLDVFNQRPGEDRPTKMVISDDCPEQFRELSGIVYKKETEIQLATRNPSEDVEKKEDHCFSAETLISTLRGYIPIDSINQDDMVLTRSGYKSVLRHGQTGVLQTYNLEFSNGSVLRCTANHPIFTENRGFVRADELRYEDLCVADRKWKKKKSFSMGSFFGDIRNHLEQTTETTLSAIRNTLSEGFATCTAKYGSITLAKYQLTMWFTTKTETPAIMMFLTWSASPRKTTARDIGLGGERALFHLKERRFGLATVKNPNHGTLPPLEENGIQRMLQKHGVKWRWSLVFARSAAMRLRLQKLKLRMRSFVTKTAAQKPSVHVARLKKFSASAIVPVYNLTVQDQHEYFANGILVHNSYDEMRYCIMSWDAEAEWVRPISTNPFALDNIEARMDEDDERDVDPDFF